ncbi:MAG: alpha/beta hydrolase [Rhodospirillaceae bacterium]|nr:alpha/beta hydrolase [Rhodospirillaceae bacterium]
MLLHGRAEFLEKYEETARELIARRFHVVSFDWRGQGLSSRLLANPRKGHVGAFADYLDDLAAVMGWVVREGPPGPVWGLAHSMGGLVALQHLARLPRAAASPLAALVVTAPLLGLARNPSQERAMAALAGLAVRHGLARSYAARQGNRHIADRGFAGNPLTTDRTRFEALCRALAVNPGLRIGGVTWGWLHQAMGAMYGLRQGEVGRLADTPVLILGAERERVVRNSALRPFAQRCGAASVVMLPGSEHEILQERDAVRDAFWAVTDGFLRDVGL